MSACEGPETGVSLEMLLRNIGNDEATDEQSQSKTKQNPDSSIMYYTFIAGVKKKKCNIDIFKAHTDCSKA